MIDKKFIEYVIKERREFELSIHGDWMSFSKEERVNMENLLIAYDQMLDKLKEISVDWTELEKEFNEINDGNMFSGIGYNAGGAYSYANSDEIFCWLKEKLK